VELDWLMAAVSRIRTIRSEMNIPPTKKVPLLLSGDTQVAPLLTRHEVSL
jgi:valyl-tRNA synthetase